jgi:hypothetical protein
MADIQTSQFDITAIYNFPASDLQASAFDVSLVTTSEPIPLEVSQFDLTVVCKLRIFDPIIRAWTFTLDGHDFYVLRLGNEETLVFDLQTQQWFKWGSGESSLWSAYTGINWFGGNNFSSVYGSNVLVGSDINGSVFFLDPLKDEDDSSTDGRSPRTFVRRVTAQLPMRGYDQMSMYEVQLLGSVGQLTTVDNTGINLSYSDDRGRSYIDAGTVDVPDGEYDVRAHWQSLGSFGAPGRIIRIEDTGALRRIDSLSMVPGNENK